MRITPAFESALQIICQRLEEAAFPWAVTGSLGMRLQGMDLEPRDLDLQSTADGAYRIQALLAEFVTLPLFFKASERIRSHFGAMEIHGLAVEVMGDMEKLRPDGTWEPAPNLPAVTRWIVYQGLLVPVMDLRYERESYRLMGRAAKAELIRAFLERPPDHTSD